MKTLSTPTIKVITRLFLLALLLAVSALMSAMAMASPNAQMDMHNEHMNRLKGLSGKDFEVEFLSMMIMHHQHGVDMSALAPDRANHAQVKTLAQNIIAAQSSEITEMTQWLKQWYDVAPKMDMMHEGMGMDMMHETMMKKLEGLKGDEFDKEFLVMMRMHHQGALEMAELIPDRATHGELKTLGTNIITSQTAEIRDMEDWLKSWYNLDVTNSAMPGEGMMGGGMMGGGGMTGANQPGMPRTGSAVTEGAFVNALVLAALFLCTVALGAGVWLRKRA